MSEAEAKTKTKVSPIISLVLRVLTLFLLLASLIILATDSATFSTPLSTQDVTIRLNYVYSYRYMLSISVLGLAYTFLQLPFAIYHVSSGKRLVENVGLLYFDFFCDKVMLSLVATGVGAGFGATYDLKKNIDKLDDIFKNLGDDSLSNIRSDLDNFFNMGFVSASLLLLGFLCFGVSSTLSSLALFKRPRN